MAKTISTHNGSVANREHNIRAEYVARKEPHIDLSLSKYNEIILDIKPQDAYENIFGSAVAEYNKKQKTKGHSERCIDNYYQKIKKDKKKHPVYEMIVQIGDRTDTGINALAEKECIKEFIDDWKQRNPNLELIGAYIHTDETQGTLHAHLDYIPVAYNCNRGLTTQNALVKALEQQGFVGSSAKETAQIAWQRRENATLEQICIAHGIEIKHPNESKKHLPTEEYKLQQISNELKQKEEILKDLEGKILSQKELNAINGKKTLTGGLKGVGYEEYLSLKKTAENSLKMEKRAKDLKRENETLKNTVKDLKKEMEEERKVCIVREQLLKNQVKKDLEQELERKYKGYAYRKIPYRKTALSEITKGLCCAGAVDTQKKEIIVKCPIFEVAMLDEAIQKYEKQQNNQQKKKQGLIL